LELQPHEATTSGRLPRVAIVGRPNVGKSTLFNRLLGRRRAITDATPGVTRDPVEVRTELGGRGVLLVDTGGYTTDRDELAELISSRAIEALSASDAILLLLDATDVTALDLEFMERLRPFNEKMTLVINKIDTEARENLVWDFYEYGITPVIGISSAHGRGIDELIDHLVAELPEESETAGPPDETDPSEIRIAVLGQPNTGKSTLVNRLTGSTSSMVSPVPGTTRDVIEGRFASDGHNFYILDTAGIRRKKKVSESIEYYSVTRAIDTIDQAEVVVLLVDAEKGLSDQDKKIAALVADRGRGLILGLNKWDLLPQVGNQFQAVEDRIRYMFPIVAFAPIVPLSAQTGSGVPALIKEIQHVRNQLLHRVETGKLNRHLADWVERTPPPVHGHRGRPKFRYMTQTNRLPVTFVAFVKHKKAIPESYVGYLKNQIRKDFGMTKIPFRLELRER
jgi:GTP-binding protein